MFLRRLEISGNALRTLPSLAGARSLRRLDASSNRLESLPDDLAHCAELAELVVNANPSLEALPADLGLFQPSLRGVWARGCGLTTLSRGLEAAAGLVDLDVGANRLRELPDALGGASRESGERASFRKHSAETRNVSGETLPENRFFLFLLGTVQRRRDAANANRQDASDTNRRDATNANRRAATNANRLGARLARD